MSKLHALNTIAGLHDAHVEEYFFTHFDELYEEHCNYQELCKEKEADHYEALIINQSK